MDDIKKDFIRDIEDLNRLLMHKSFNDIKEQMKRDSDLSSEYTDFIIKFLTTKKSGRGRISQLLLDKNGIKTSLIDFMIKQDAEKYEYAIINYKCRSYYALKITQRGINRSSILSITDKIIPLTQIESVNLYIFKRIRDSISSVLVSTNNRMSKIMKSWIIVFISIILAVLTFLLDFLNIF